jgi:sodium-dependent dicarboxylate transporter 2/3/5
MSLRFWSTLGGAVLAGSVYAAMRLVGMPDAQCTTAAVTCLCAVWWIFESLPLPATSLVPLVVFPLTGVLTEEQAAAAYGDPIVLLFMGGFMLSKAAEHWGAHRRIAEAMLARTGRTSGRQVVLAMMLATALVSMWISNTATALMMLPVALAVVESDRTGKLGVPLLLGVGYAASIGGIATPIGTPPNGVFSAVYRNVTSQSVPFHQWMAVGGVVAILMLGAAWVVLCLGLRGVAPVNVASDQDHGWTAPQKRTLAIFGLAALAWITREIPFGGWSSLIGFTAAGDTTVAIAAVVALFLIPSGEQSGERLLDWRTAAGIPWGVLILFGGGIAIATAFESSKLSTAIGETIHGLGDWPTLAIIAAVSLGVTFLSEVTSNTATSNILMPILAAAAQANELDPALLMFPATLSNSLAFMMPVGTPPNAIVYGTGHVRIADMVRYGLVLNLIGVVIVTVVCWKLLPAIFGVSAVNP